MKALTIGSAMIDTIAIIDDDRIERMSMRNTDVSYLLLEQGRKVEAATISQHIGGGGVNAAVCLARLGHEVACAVKLGADERADDVLARLREEGVETRGAARDPSAATGAAILVGAHDRDISIFTCRGANTRLRAEDVPIDLFGAALVYVAPLSNQAADALPAIMSAAKAAGATLAVNPGVRQLGRRAGDFIGAAGAIDILSMNRAEAATLLPRMVERVGEGGPALRLPGGATPPPLAQSGFSAGGFDMSLSKYLAALLDLGVGAALITDGAHGAYAARNGVIHFRPTEPAAVAATVGAGDAFAASFAAWLAETDDVAAALDAAAVNAASVVAAVDAQSGLLRRAALEERLAALGPDRADALSWSIEG